MPTREFLITSSVIHTIKGFVVMLSLLALSGCATTESHQTIEPTTVASKITAATYSGVRYPMIVGAFQNRSTYQNGLFSSGSDRLGTQAKTILSTHLQQTGRFSVMDRGNMDTLAEESGYAKTEQEIKGAKYVITGDVTEFGRKVTGDQQLFGLLGSSKTQTAYSKVALQVVDVRTSEVVFSAQGAGTYDLKNREVLGTGGTAGYDSTLNGKVLNLAITEAVNRLVEGLENGAWSVN